MPVCISRPLKLFEYVSLSLLRGCLDYCDLWCPGFSPFISWTGFDFFLLFYSGFYWWRMSLCQIFPCLIVEFVDSIEGCSSSISLVVFTSYFIVLIIKFNV